MASEFKIGTTLGGIVSLDSLTVPIVDPKTGFEFYSRLIDLGDGTKRGAGWPMVSWTYGYVTQAQRNQFRVFCPNLASSVVYIRTRTRDLVGDPSTLFKTYRAVMIWPSNENYRASRRLDFILQFIRLELQT